MASEWREWGLPEAVIPRLHQVAGAMEHSIGLARAAGVTIGSGTDLIGPRQNRRGLELVLRARVEDPMTAIVAATSVNARILRVADRLGTVEAGKLADVIAVRGDPLTDPELFDDPDRVVLVVKGGAVQKNALT